jgi:SAM-dependent methyltransferase
VRYALAIFLSSSLLFLIEPIAGKRVLPLLGGSAAVWTACLVFFQSALLLGYFTAHWLATHTNTRTQVVAFGSLLALSLVQLVRAIDPAMSADAAHPIASVLWLLTALIGVPFVTLSATSPLLQSWFARSAATTQPYRLFAVSNVGSLLALLVYPVLIEPRLRLRDQTAALTVGFAVFVAVCAAIAYSVRGAPLVVAGESPLSVPPSAADPPARSRPVARRNGVVDPVLWISLAACASLLLSAVTNHLSQNVATFPLLWIIPLVLYLLSFVVAFGSERWRPRWLMLGVGVAGLGLAGYHLWRGAARAPIGQSVAIYCGALFLLCLFCHAELYARRPAPRHLTGFYLAVAAGGALGALCVGVLAPTLLSGNYELTGGLCLAAALGLAVTWSSGWLARLFWLTATALMLALLVRQVKADRSNSLVSVRNFYGKLRVTEGMSAVFHATYRSLYNGSILHGEQVFSRALRATPTTYYGHESGVGLALDRCCPGRPRRVGVIGLGTGTIAAYGRAGDLFRFYDINAAVERIARTKFAYLRDSPATIEVVIGDARVSLAAEPPQQFDVLVVDAFSGDAIPVHLLTAQALELYRRHLRHGGIVAFHVSNHYLDLSPVVQQLADGAGLATAFVSSEDDSPRDVYSADWVLVTDNQSFLADSSIVRAREPITIPPRLRRWTDDYNSLLPVLHIK